MGANEAEPAVGILYPGELGCRLGRLLIERGRRVVTTLEGRGDRTRRLAADTPFEVLATTRDVVRTAGVVLSTVPPAAAVAVARECAALVGPGARLLYVDVNSVSPATAGEVETAVGRSGMDFVDAAVHGMAAQLPVRGTLYLSGGRAAEVARLFGPPLRVKVLDGPAGRASAFKMLISGLAKGAVALVLEMALAARRAGLLGELLACYRDAYPGIMDLFERQLPTYPQHAARRGDELAEVERTFRGLGLEPRMIPGAGSLTSDVGRLGLPPDARRSVLDVLEAVYARNPLADHHPAGGPGTEPRPAVRPNT